MKAVLFFGILICILLCLIMRSEYNSKVRIYRCVDVITGVDTWVNNREPSKYLNLGRCEWDDKEITSSEFRKAYHDFKFSRGNIK